MADDYKSIPTVGQIDKMSCWAACLAWWLAAVKDGRPSWNQLKIISEFDAHCAADGGFAPEKILEVWPRTTALKISGGVFKTSAYRHSRMPLGNKPVIIAFNYPSIGGTHMNVVFGYDSTGHARKMTAMEPYHPHPGTDGKRTGAFLERDVDFYIKDSPNVLLFWPTVVFT